MREAVHRRTVVRQTLGRMMQRLLARAFGRWEEAVAQSRRLSDVARKVIVRIQQRALCGALEGWIALVGQKHARAAAMHKVALRMLRPRLVMGFDGWAEAIHTHKTQRALLARGLAKLSHLSLIHI